MLNWLKSLFSETQERRDVAGHTHDPRTAAAALLVETALTDGIYANIESTRIIEVLKTSFALDDPGAKDILRQAEDLAEQATGAHQYTKLVKNLNEEERVLFVEGLYYVSFADGEKCPYEDAFVRHVASLLHVPDRDRAEARKRAEQKSSAELN